MSIRALRVNQNSKVVYQRSKQRAARSGGNYLMLYHHIHTTLVCCCQSFPRILATHPKQLRRRKKLIWFSTGTFPPRSFLTNPWALPVTYCGVRVSTSFEVMFVGTLLLLLTISCFPLRWWKVNWIWSFRCSEMLFVARQSSWHTYSLRNYCFFPLPNQNSAFLTWCLYVFWLTTDTFRP